jgi:hypothetical protein
MIAEAFERAKKVRIADITAGCKQCTRLGRPCNEHKGILHFLPKQLELWQP